MKVNISKTLEGIIARAVFNITKAGLTNSYKDLFALELLSDDNSLACHLLKTKLPDRELYRARLQIEEEVLGNTESGTQSAEEFFRTFSDELRAMPYVGRSINSAHALYAIMLDRSTATSRALDACGVTADIISCELSKFLSREDMGAQIHIHVFGPRTNKPAGTSGDDPDSEQDEQSEQDDPDDAADSRWKPHPLDKFGVDLTRLAREGRIDSVVGREAEIARVVQILSRRKKNNPILIGEAGVGKSAIVEGLALRIASGDVPATIAGKRIFSLDVSLLVAGTKFRGEFEERMKHVIDELRKTQDTIVFIDEIHTIMGAGSSQGSLDTANILKPALARGELQTIGATTLDEYRTSIESDSALERRFQRIMVESPTPEQTLQILHKIAPHYERHHNVRYSAEALEACVELTRRYVTDRFFPDKAIDAMDEAGAQMHLGQTTPNLVEITGEHIRRVITSMTGIPAERITEGEMGRLRTLRDYLAGRVVGQQEAVDKIAGTIRRSRAGLKDENRPIGVFLFVGPTGVGKTLLAKELSKWLFDENRGLIRIDMSEYGEKHNVSRLIGSPPGYVGYGEGGQLTEAVRRQPYSVVLLDEIEKAHPEVFNAMLQIFDEGHLTDGSARRVDFRNTIIIMTSNAGSRAAVQRPVQVGYSTASKSASAAAPKREYRRALEQTFAPEFLNRIDNIIEFRELSIEDVERIVDLELRTLLERTRKLGYKLRITPPARRRLALMGYESRYGARSLRRTLTDHVEEPLSSLIIDGKLNRGDTVTIVVGKHCNKATDKAAAKSGKSGKSGKSDKSAGVGLRIAHAAQLCAA